MKEYEFDLKIKDKKEKGIIDRHKNLDDTNLIEVLDKYINFGVDLDGKRRPKDPPDE